MCSAMLANRKIAKGTEPNFVNAKMAKHSAARKGTEKSVNRSALPICGAVCARETRASFQAEKLTVSSPATATLQTESHSERNAITSRSAGDQIGSVALFVPGKREPLSKLKNLR